MSNLYLASIDVTKIDKSRLIEFTRKDGTKGTSLNVAIWIDDNADEDWKQCSIQQSTKKDEGKIYLGNGKKYVQQTGDLTPERDKNEATAGNPDWINEGNDGTDDLPF